MPTPFEIITHPVSLAVLGMYGVLWLLEVLFPARTLPEIPGAKLRGICGLFVFLLGSSYLPLLYEETLAEFRLLDLSELSPVFGALVGVLSYELVAYVYHRTLHSSDFLFRVVHQGHHSSERLDVASALYFHPFDMVGWTLVASLGLVFVVGLGAEATTMAVLFINFLGIFQHANLKTPPWLGYLIQRPESHSIHHGRALHRGNYADLPVFDLLFGTFENPEGFHPQTGYYDGASTRVLDMLVGKDVTTPPPLRVRGRAGVRDYLPPSRPAPESVGH